MGTLTSARLFYTRVWIVQIILVGSVVISRFSTIQTRGVQSV